jgi:hypothetical protein
MQPVDRVDFNEAEPSHRAEERRSAEIVRLDAWRRRRRPAGTFWRRVPTNSTGRPPPSRQDVTPAGRRIPIEAWLLALIVFSAVAGAIFALMGLGYLP